MYMCKKTLQKTCGCENYNPNLCVTLLLVQLGQQDRQEVQQVHKEKMEEFGSVNNSV